MPKGVDLDVRDLGALTLDDLESIVSSADFYRIPDDRRKAVASEVQRRYAGVRRGRGAGEIAGDALARGGAQTVDNLASSLSLLLPKETRDAALAGFAERARARDVALPRYVEGGVMDREKGPFASPGNFGAFALESAMEQAPNLAASLLPAGAVGTGLRVAGAGARGVANASRVAGLLGNLAMNTGENAQSLFEATGEGKPVGALAAGAGYTALDNLFGIEGQMLRRMVRKPAAEVSKDVVIATIRDAVKTGGKEILGEAWTEPAQSQIVGRLVEAYYTKAFMRPGEDWKGVLDETLTEALGAALGAGVPAAAGAAGDYRRLKADNNALADAMARGREAGPKARQAAQVREGEARESARLAGQMARGREAARLEREFAEAEGAERSGLAELMGEGRAAARLEREFDEAGRADGERARIEEVARARFDREMAEIAAERERGRPDARAAQAEAMRSARDSRRPALDDSTPRYTLDTLNDAVQSLVPYVPERQLVALGAEGIVRLANMPEREQDAWIEQNILPEAMADGRERARLERELRKPFMRDSLRAIKQGEKAKRMRQADGARAFEGVVRAERAGVAGVLSDMDAYADDYRAAWEQQARRPAGRQEPAPQADDGLAALMGDGRERARMERERRKEFYPAEARQIPQVRMKQKPVSPHGSMASPTGDLEKDLETLEEWSAKIPGWMAQNGMEVRKGAMPKSDAYDAKLRAQGWRSYTWRPGAEAPVESALGMVWARPAKRGVPQASAGQSKAEPAPPAFAAKAKVRHATHGAGEVAGSRWYIKQNVRKYTVKFPRGVQIVPESELERAEGAKQEPAPRVSEIVSKETGREIGVSVDKADNPAMDALPEQGEAAQFERDLRERRAGVEYARKSLSAMRGRLAKERSAAGRMVIQKRIDKLQRDTEEAESALAFLEKRSGQPKPEAAAESPVKVERMADGDTEVSVPKADKPGVPLKEQKRWLLAELSKAVEAVPQYEGPQADAVDAFEKKLRDFDAHPNRKTASEAGINDAKALENAGIGKVTIEVPGDGVFTIWNTRYALKRFAAKVEKKFPASPHRPSYPSVTVPRQTPLAALGAETGRVTGMTPALARSLEPFTAAEDDPRVELRSPSWNAEAGEAVAANGATLAVVLGEPGGEREGKRLFGQYPAIVPGYRAGRLPESGKERDFSAEVDTERLSRKLKQARIASDLTQTVHLMADRSGAVEVFLLDHENNSYTSLDGRRGFDLGYFSADQLLEVLDFLRGRGNANVTLTVSTKRKPSVFSGKGEYVVVSSTRATNDASVLDVETGTAFRAWAADVNAPDHVELVAKDIEERKRAAREEAEKSRAESEERAAQAEAERAAAEKRMAELRRTAPVRALKAMKASALYSGLKQALEEAGASIPENGDVLNTSVVGLRGAPKLREMQDALGKEIGIASYRQRSPFGRGKVDTRNFDLTGFWKRDDYFEEDVFQNGVAEPEEKAAVADGKPEPDLPGKREQDALTRALVAEPESGSGAVTASAPKTVKKPDAVEDAGEELRYNRRGRGGSRTWEDVKDMNPALKAREVVKGNVWPKPDYEALIADGMEPVVAYMIKTVYDGISSKPVPRSAYHRAGPVGRPGLSDDDFKRYIDAVNRVREGVKAWADDPVAVRGWASENARRASALLNAMGGKVVQISELSGKTVDSILSKVYPEGWKAYQDEIMAIGGNKALRALQPGTDEAVKAVKAIGKGWPKSREAWQVRGYEVVKEPHTDIQRSGGSGGEAFVTVNRKGYKRFGSVAEAKDFVAAMRPYVLLKKNGGYVASFDTEEEAVEAARAEVGVKAGGDGVEPGGSRSGNVAQAEREGPARRLEGEDVTAQRIIDDFGMRGVNFGNWMKTPAAKAEAQEHLNRAYDALHDLAELLGVPPKAVSLNGMLGLAIGAQGNGGKNAAHFVPGLNEINLTRTAGAGTLAHEWGHALDHYFANQAGLATREHPFVSEYAEYGSALGAGLRKEVADAFRAVVRTMKSRDVTQDEARAIAERRAGQTRRSLDNWLERVGRDFTDKEAYGRLAERIRSGELGDGKVAASSRVYLSPALVELRELFKRQTGRLYSLDETNNVQNWADAVARDAARKEAGEEHVPQTVTTDYVRNALALDKDKGGKKYWSTPRELFARAFDAYVADTLKGRGERNTYLSREGNEKGSEPEGGERSAIGKAFATLVDAIETRETEKGVEMYSVSRGEPRGMEMTDAEREEYQGRVSGWFEKARRAEGLTRDEIADKYSHSWEPVGKIAPDYAHVFGGEDTTVYGAEWFFIDHVLNHHPELTADAARGMVDAMHAPDEVRIDTDGGKRSLIFVRRNVDGSYSGVVVARRNTRRGELYIHKSTLSKNEKPYQSYPLAEPLSPARSAVPVIPSNAPLQPKGGINLYALQDGESVADARAGVNDDSRADIEAAASAMGVTVEWGDPVEMQGIDGMARDGRVVLNPDADRGALLRFTFGHEVAHLMEGGKGWAAFLLRLEKLVGRGAVDTYLADLNRRRGKIGLEPLTKKQALREIAADLVGARMADARFWAKVRNLDAPLWRRVVDWVKGWFGKVVPGVAFDARALFDSPAAFAEAMKDVEREVLTQRRGGAETREGGAADEFSVSEDQTESPEFKKRFGNSKVSMGGKPLMTAKGAERDAEYLKAVEAGDMETAQRMVDEAAKAAGYNTGPVWHSSSEVFNVFRKRYERDGVSSAQEASLIGRFGKGIFFSSDPVVSEKFGRVKRKFYLKIDELTEYDLGGASYYDGTLHDQETGEVLLDDDGEPMKVDQDMLPDEMSEIQLDDSGTRNTGVIVRGVYESIPSKGKPKPMADTYVVGNPSQIKSADIVVRDDAGNVIPLSERFNPASPDIRYSVSRSGDPVTAIGRLFRGFQAARASEPDSRDLSPWAVLFGQIAWYSERVPTLRRLFERAQKALDDRHEIAARYFGVRGQGDSDLNTFLTFMRGDRGPFSRRVSEEGRRLNDYLLRVDRDRDGARIEEEGGRWKVTAPKDGGGVETVFEGEGEQAALDAMHDWECERLLRLGFSVEAAKALRAFRDVHDREYADLVKAYRDHAEEMADLGIKPDDEWKDLFNELRKIGNLRGTYFPRLRQGGRYVLSYQQDGLRYLERFDTAAQRMAREAKVRAAGAENVSKGLTDTPSEEAFDSLQMVSLNDFLKNALGAVERVGDRMDWEAIGLRAKYYDYTRKDGVTERHLVIRSADGGEAGKVFATWFKDAGGRFYETKQTGPGKAWHFIEPTPKDSKRIYMTAARLFYGRTMPAQVFGRLLVGQVARMIEGRGASARKIARSDAVGADVWRGYEEDAARAMVRNANAVAGSRAKSSLAKEMLHIVAGTDISWATFKAQHDDLSPAEAWSAYEAEVEERRLDSAKQPVAWKEARSFISEMLRNESGAERAAGWLSGMAALWRLSGAGAAAVNLTSMVTTVPAAAHTYAKIPFAETARRTARAGADYVRWARAERFGGKSGLDADSQWLFDEIKKRGWEDAVFIEQAASALRNDAGEAMSMLDGAALFAFGATERFNRASTVAAVYRALAAREKDVGEARRSELLEEAKRVSDKAHGVYGKVARPAWTRGDGAGSLVLRSGYVFKTYTHNLLNLMVDSGLRRRDAKAALWLALSPAVFGLAASPVAAAAYAVAAVLRALGGDIPDDPHEVVFAWIRGALGDGAERFARTGVTGLAGVDVSGSLAMIPDENILERPAWELAGAPAGILADWLDAARLAAAGEGLAAAERAAPRALQAKLKAWREYREGVSTRRDAPVFWGEERMKASLLDAFVRAGGLNPAALSVKRNRQWSEKKAADRLGETKREVYDGWRAWSRAGRTDRAEAERLLLAAAEYNAMARAHAANPSVTPITPRSLRQVIGAADRAPSWERRRERDTRDWDGAARMGAYEDFEAYMRRAGRVSGFGRVSAARLASGRLPALPGMGLGLRGLRGLGGL